VAFLTN